MLIGEYANEVDGNPVAVAWLGNTIPPAFSCAISKIATVWLWVAAASEEMPLSNQLKEGNPSGRPSVRCY